MYRIYVCGPRINRSDVRDADHRSGPSDPWTPDHAFLNNSAIYGLVITAQTDELLQRRTIVMKMLKVSGSCTSLCMVLHLKQPLTPPMIGSRFWIIQNFTPNAKMKVIVLPCRSRACNSIPLSLWRPPSPWCSPSLWCPPQAALHFPNPIS